MQAIEHFINNNAYFSIILCLVVYFIAQFVGKRINHPLYNSFFVALVIVIIIVSCTGIDPEKFSDNTLILSFFIGPATACFAVNMYKFYRVLKENFSIIVVSVLCGCIASALTTFALCKLFGINYEIFASMLPRSVTTAIAIGIANEIHAVVAILLINITLNAILGPMIAPLMKKYFKIDDPLSMGICLGNTSHILGVTSALEYGKTEAAFASVTIIVAGLITVVIAPILAAIY